MAKAALKPKPLNAERSMGLLGEAVLSDQRQTIDRSIGIAPNKPSTVERKGSSRPLIDTGALKRSTTYVVRSKGQEVAKGGGT
jgi:hypothetical protein